MAVNPADGCVPGHVREPGPDGKFNGHWALDCPMCEMALASDPHWAGDPSDVPLTPEEKKAQTRLAEQGQNNAAQMAQFFGQMMQAFQIQQGQAPSAQQPVPVVACASCGAPGMQGARFCAACGTPVTIAGSALPPEPPPALAAPAVEAEGSHRAAEQKPAAAQAEPSAEAVPPDDASRDPAELANLKIVQLRALAKEAGLSQAGSKAELVARLEASQLG